MISYVTCVDIKAQVSLTLWSMFLFLDLPTLKLTIIIIILLTDRPQIITPITRTTKNEVVFAWESSKVILLRKQKFVRVSKIIYSSLFSSPQHNVSCLAGLLLVLEELWQIISLYLLSVEACFTEGVEWKLYCQEVVFCIRLTRTTFEF